MHTQANARRAAADADNIMMQPAFHLGRSNTKSQQEMSPNGTPVPPSYMMTPKQIRNAYDITDVGNGRGQTIAIIVAYGNPKVKSDLQVFSSAFGLPCARLTIAYPQGRPTAIDNNWALETNLDTQWVHAIAPGAKILLVVAKTNSLNDLLGAVDYAVKNGAKQITMSWGSPEWPQEVNYDYHFNVKGVSFFAASGDQGTGSLYPAASPFVTGVGGTSLYVDANGNKLASETAWFYSGGGISPYEGGNDFQASFTNPQPGHRMIPDVSYNADPYTGFAVYDSLGINGQSGWIQVGGTSAGSPQWAAIIALANQQHARMPVGYANYPLYSLAAPDIYANFYSDVLEGCNSTLVSIITCAHASYDSVTGLGTPVVSQLLENL
jgi:subtilase family serine protease